MHEGAGSESLAWKIMRLIARCGSLAGCGPELIELLARYGHWRAGEIWLRENENLEMRYAWYAPEIGVLSTYWADTHGGAIDELIARAISTEQPAWDLLAEDDERRRAVALRRIGITKIVAIPILGHAAVSGAMVFFSSRKRPPSPRKVEQITRFAMSVGVLIERLRAEAALRESEFRTRTIIESAAAAIVTVDGDGTILFVNRAFERLFGYTAGEIAGQNVACLVPPEHRAAHTEYIHRYMETGESEIVGRGREVTGVRRDGTQVEAFLTVADLRLPGQRLFTGMVHDLASESTAIEDLRRSRTFLADAQRLAHIGNWSWDIRTNDVECSDEVFRIFDVSPATFRPTFENFLSRMHPDDQPRVRAALDDTLTTLAHYAVEYRVLRSDGAVAHVFAQGEVQLEAGVPVRVLGTVQDTTQLRRAHENLWKLYSAVEQTADEVVITDREGRIEYVNPAFEAATGYTLSEIAGRTPRILKSGLHAASEYERLWATILSGEVYRGVFMNRAKDGRILHEEKTITPVRDEQGAISHFVATGRDITERRKAEKQQEELRMAVEQSATAWRRTFDAIALPILLVDSAGTVRRTNRAAAELLREDFVGRHVSALPREEPWKAASAIVLETIESDTPRTAQVAEPRSARTWELATTVFPSGAPEESKVILLASEVTRVIELQESLRRTELMSALGSLVAGVAHEVRNPLFAISATIDAFEDRTLDTAEFTNFAARLRAEVNRLTGLMVELLEYGRPVHTELGFGLVSESLLEAVRSTEDLARDCGVTLDVRSSGENVTINADRKRLHLAFRNLIDNAIRHAGQHGRVLVETVAQEDIVEVRIADSGPGVPEEDLPRLFEPFYTRRRDGTGLGLAVVQRVIEQHGGTVVLENAPGGGAVARVRLPLAAAPALLTTR